MLLAIPTFSRIAAGGCSHSYKCVAMANLYGSQFILIPDHTNNNYIITD